MKKKLSLQREILERIDYFNYLDPDSLCADCKEKDQKKDDKEEEETSEEELSSVKKYSKPADVRRYLQYVNAKND